MKQKKTVWLIQQTGTPPELGQFIRHYSFAKYLKRDGYRPVVFAGSKIHNTDMQMIRDKRRYQRYPGDGFPFYFIRTFDYGNSKAKQILAELQFFWNLYQSKEQFPRPDVILGSSSPMLVACFAILLAREMGCKSIAEVRDIWPESIVDFLGYSRNNPVIQFLYQVEKWMYANADALIFTMEGGSAYITEHKLDTAHGGRVDLNKVHHINNGVDLEDFRRNRRDYPFYDADLADPRKLCVVYTGSVRTANHLQYIADIAKFFNGTNVHFLIFGSGNEVEPLKAYCKEQDIRNIAFKGSVEKKFIPSLLSQADFLLLHVDQKNVIRQYGLSANKMFDYIAAGKPIISTVSGRFEIISANQAGILCPNDDAGKAAQMIRALAADPVRQKQCAENARRLLKQYHFCALTRKLEELL